MIDETRQIFYAIETTGSDKTITEYYCTDDHSDLPFGMLHKYILSYHEARSAKVVFIIKSDRCETYEPAGILKRFRRVELYV